MTSKPKQIVLRIDDEHGHHIIRIDGFGGYTIEGYTQKPDNYLKAPSYFFPISKDETREEFIKQGKEFKDTLCTQ
jgi:hypothetical protein